MVGEGSRCIPPTIGKIVPTSTLLDYLRSCRGFRRPLAPFVEEYDHSELEEDTEHEDDAHDHPLVDGLRVGHFGRLLSVGVLLFCVLLLSLSRLMFLRMMTPLLFYNINNEKMG